MNHPHGSLPRHLQAYFTGRLMLELSASKNTIASYRDTFRQLVQFAAHKLARQPAQLDLTDLDASLICEFLQHLETTGHSVRTRNQRLAAIRSFAKFVSFHEPGQSELIQRILALPSKKHERVQVQYLTLVEAEGLLKAPDRGTWLGRRDHVLLLVAIQTGLRVSELTGLTVNDVHLGHGPHVRCRGKGRKERCTPLTRQTVKALRAWLVERGGTPTSSVFPNRNGGRLSADGVQYLLAKYVAIARCYCPSLQEKRVSPHVLRHTTAMNLLHAGVDRAIIALWLGHESVETTQIYLEASLAMKEQALAKTASPETARGRFRPKDELLRFLQSL